VGSFFLGARKLKFKFIQKALDDEFLVKEYARGMLGLRRKPKTEGAELCQFELGNFQISRFFRI